MKNLEYRSGENWKDSAENEKIEGYAAVINQRAVMYSDPDTGIEYGERISSGAFDGADISDVTFVLQHQSTPVYARTRNGSLKLKVDDHGLLFSADLASDKGKELYKEIRSGLYDQCSFAFTVADEHYENSTRTRVIDKIAKVYDVSVCDRGAYPQTEVHCRSIEAAQLEDRTAFIAAEARSMQSIFADIVSSDRVASSYCDERDGDIKAKLCELRDATYMSIAEVRTAKEKASDLVDELLNREAKRVEARNAVANGAGKALKDFAENTEKRGSNMNEFFDKMIEKRAAAAVSGMGNVIPTDIIGSNLRVGNNGLYDHISLTTINHAGDLKIPYIADSSITVGSHTENASITPSDTVPSAVTITHSELQATLGYSYLGASLATEQFKNIVTDGLMSAMRKKLDAVAVTAINSTTWATTGTGKNSINWSDPNGGIFISDLLKLMDLLPEQYATGAAFVMNRYTLNSILMRSTGVIDTTLHSNEMYNFKPTDAVNTMWGIPIVLDQNMSNMDVFYGCPNAVHMNIAGDVMMNNWLDHDSLTEKFQVACAAGAGIETGCFVKGCPAPVSD